MRKAFTLIELLVVISIIAMLIAILLPALGAARESARSTQCLSNTRQFATSAYAHAADNRQHIPMGGEIVADNATVQGFTRNLQTFSNAGFNLPLPIAAALGEYMGIDIRTGSLANMQADLDDPSLTFPFICPSDEEVSRARQITYVNQSFTAVFGLTSYGPNDSLVGYNTSSALLDRVNGNLEKVNTPSKVMFMGDVEPDPGGKWNTFYENRIDADLFHAWSNFGGGRNQRFCDNSNGKNQSRHARETMNIAFADGHAESVEISNESAMRDVWLSKGLGKE